MKPMAVPNSNNRLHLYFIGCIFLFLFLGCNLAGPSTAPTPTPLPTITQNPIFATNTPLPESESIPEGGTEDDAVSERVTPSAPTFTGNATNTPIPTAFPTPTPNPTFTVYDEALHPDWELTYSSMPHEFIESPAAFSGSQLIEMRPDEGRQVLFFTVREGASRIYLHEEILAATFQFYSASGVVGPTDWSMAVIGSDLYPYFVQDDPTISNLDPDWIPKDASVTGIYDFAFSPTRFEHLGMRSTAAEKTWFELNNWLEDRSFDIEYKYVTGIYLKNDDEFIFPVGVDSISLVIEPPSQLLQDR